MYRIIRYTDISYYSVHSLGLVKQSSRKHHARFLWILLATHHQLHSSTRVADNLQPGGWSEHDVPDSAGEPCHNHLHSGRGRFSHYFGVQMSNWIGYKSHCVFLWMFLTKYSIVYTFILVLFLTKYSIVYTFILVLFLTKYSIVYTFILVLCQL